MRAQIDARRERLQQTHVQRMYMMLTVDQRVKWNAPLLNDELSGEFAQVLLEPKQTERIKMLSDRQARSLTFPIDPANHEDKRLNALKLQIYRTILTPAQQAEYRKLKTPAAPPGKDGKNRKGKG